HPHKSITTNTGFFTNEIAKSYRDSGSNILFISDIRNQDIVNLGGQHYDDMILNDNKKQLDWVQIINPRYAFLKFRPPYLPGKSQYLAGEIYLQCYAPPS